MMMFKGLGFTVVAASLLFGLAPAIAGGDSLATSSPGHDDVSANFASLFRQAPVGHRQPHRSDAPETTQLSPSDSELRRLDEEIDRKLTICRGC
jgi:hypothetical protein